PVAGTVGGVVVAPAGAGAQPRGPDPGVEDDGADGEAVGLADEVLGDGPAELVVGLADRAHEHVDRAPVVVGGALHVAGRDALGLEAAEVAVGETRSEVEAYGVRALGQPRLLEVGRALVVGAAEAAGEGTGGVAGERGGEHAGVVLVV